MFERYTERARRVIFFARYEASSLASVSIDTEHLLLGLLRERAAMIEAIFERAGVTYQAVQKELENRALPSAPVSTAVDIPLSGYAKAALVRASEEATRMESANVDSAHLLLGLLGEPEGLAAQMLTARGMSLEEVREEIRLRAQAKPSARPEDPFRKLAVLLARLDSRHAVYHVSAFREDAIRVEVSLAEEKWVVTFFRERATVQVFSPSGPVEDEGGLARLLERLEHPKS
jgi:ATP-dependent Clp protease ATP-binding subunit ClpA